MTWYWAYAVSSLNIYVALCTNMPWSTWKRLVHNTWLSLTSLKACDWPGHIFSASASPRSFTKTPAMSPSSTAVHGGHRDTKYLGMWHTCGIRGWRNLGWYAWTSSCLSLEGQGAVALLRCVLFINRNETMPAYCCLSAVFSDTDIGTIYGVPIPIIIINNPKFSDTAFWCSVECAATVLLGDAPCPLPGRYNTRYNTTNRYNTGDNTRYSTRYNTRYSTRYVKV